MTLSPTITPERLRCATPFKRLPLNGGFTLIEIIIAVLILSSSLVILMGIQSSTVERAIEGRASQQAMLVARDILSAIETVKDPELIQDASGTAEEVIKSISGGDPLPEGGVDPDRRFSVELQIEKVSLPTLGDDKMRRLLLRLTWEGGPPQGLVIEYFMAMT